MARLSSHPPGTIYDADDNPIGVKSVVIESKGANLKSPKNRNRSKVYIYPSARDIREYEDSFKIQAIEYIVPGEGDGTGASITGDISAMKTALPYDKRKLAELESIFPGYSKLSREDRLKLHAENDLPANNKDVAKQLKLEVQNEDRTEIFEKRGFATKSKFFIELPIPQQVSDTSSVSWGDDTINIFEMAGLALGKNIIEGGKDIKFSRVQAILKAMSLGIDLPNVDDNVSNAVKAAVTGQALNAFGSNLDVNSILARSTGQVLNSNLELLFKGVNLRTFPFDVTFSPRNPKEADVVRNIIRKLKQAMSARRTTNQATLSGQSKLLLNPPDLFILRYLKNGKDHPFLNSFKPCALTQLNVNYTGAGTYATYGDSTPTNIQMRMVFKEINPIYAEDYDGKFAGPGVGF